MILIPISQTLMVNLLSHRQPRRSRRGYWTSGILFPSLRIAATQPYCPSGPDIFSSGSECFSAAEGNPRPTSTTPNQSSRLRTTGVLPSLLLPVYSLFSSTSFLLRYCIYSHPIGICRQGEGGGFDIGTVLMYIGIGQGMFPVSSHHLLFTPTRQKYS